MSDVHPIQFKYFNPGGKSGSRVRAVQSRQSNLVSPGGKSGSCVRDMHS